MYLLKKALHLFVFSSIYIACCAVVMTWQTRFLLSLSCNGSRYLLFVFFATLCSYNFHWYVTAEVPSEKIRTAWTMDNKKLHAVFFLLGVSGALYYFLFFSAHWIVISIAALLTFLYSAPNLSARPFIYLRKIAVGKTLFLAAVWMYVTTLLPILIGNDPITANGVWLCINRFFFIYAVCILFDYRDRISDRQRGIRSMITYFGEAGINRLFYFSMLIFFVSTAVLWSGGLGINFAGSSFLSGILLLWLYPIARNNFSDYLYYIILDGLMMLSGLIQLISYF